jgi:hypothetical protein
MVVTFVNKINKIMIKSLSLPEWIVSDLVRGATEGRRSLSAEVVMRLEREMGSRGCLPEMGGKKSASGDAGVKYKSLDLGKIEVPGLGEMDAKYMIPAEKLAEDTVASTKEIPGYDVSSGNPVGLGMKTVPVERAGEFWKKMDEARTVAPLEPGQAIVKEIDDKPLASRPFKSFMAGLNLDSFKDEKSGKNRAEKPGASVGPGAANTVTLTKGLFSQEFDSVGTAEAFAKVKNWPAGSYKIEDIV